MSFFVWRMVSWADGCGNVPYFLRGLRWLSHGVVYSVRCFMCNVVPSGSCWTFVVCTLSRALIRIPPRTLFGCDGFFFMLQRCPFFSLCQLRCVQLLRCLHRIFLYLDWLRGVGYRRCRFYDLRQLCCIDCIRDFRLVFGGRRSVIRAIVL